MAVQVDQMSEDELAINRDLLDRIVLMGQLAQISGEIADKAEVEYSDAFDKVKDGYVNAGGNAIKFGEITGGLKQIYEIDAKINTKEIIAESDTITKELTTKFQELKDIFGITNKGNGTYEKIFSGLFPDQGQLVNSLKQSMTEIGTIANQSTADKSPEELENLVNTFKLKVEEFAKIYAGNFEQYGSSTDVNQLVQGLIKYTKAAEDAAQGIRNVTQATAEQEKSLKNLNQIPPDWATRLTNLTGAIASTQAIWNNL